VKYFRIITPTGWIALFAVFCVLFGLASVARPSFLGLKFDPFGIDARKLDRLEGQVSVLERQATGQAEISTAVERHYSRETIIRDGTSEAIAQARSAPDAATPLDPMRADRLRAADQWLCKASPSLCADSNPARSRPDAMPPAGPAK